MGRSRVLSFMSQWGAPPRSPTTDSPPASPKIKAPAEDTTPSRRPANIDTTTPQSSIPLHDSQTPQSPTAPSRARGDSRVGSRPSSRPSSMIQTYQPPQVDVARDTPPELQPIFSFLNSHSNKLYQEGYFLKLHDLDSRGRPSADRAWTECFAQLVGTVLSLWDAASLDQAGEDGEVVPTFINLSDASLKMIESLPMNGVQGGSLQNVLSISTAANNRYLLHFNSLNSLTQWTAGIRLAMFEHSTLQEAYTGSLIAGKGKMLNNIKMIMERAKFPYEDWARVRFGAGTPWRRCWCVITPPDEKDYQKAQKLVKKGSAYDRVKVPKGDIKFYDTRKINKKTKPIATISDAYAAYAIYPQSKPLIDQSTLVKVEGQVTMHAAQDATTEAFVFVMPEVHAAVTGFEMMLRWLFPLYDTFALYGRPSRLIADSLDQRGLMFALPRDRRYGYLDILDVAGLIHTKGSQSWTERQWRRELKQLTSTRMMNNMDAGSDHSRQSSQRRSSLMNRPAARFDDSGPVHSSPGSRSASPAQFSGAEDQTRLSKTRRDGSAPPASHGSPHKRSASDAYGYKNYKTENPSRLSYEASRNDYDSPPPPPKHVGNNGAFGRTWGPGSLDRITSSDAVPTIPAADATTQYLPPPEPVSNPPVFTHNPRSRPANQPYQAPDLRRAHSNVDDATLLQMQDAVRTDGGWSEELSHRTYPQQQNLVHSSTPLHDNLGVTADRSQGLNSSDADLSAATVTVSGAALQQRAIDADGRALVGREAAQTDPDTTSLQPYGARVQNNNRVEQLRSVDDRPLAGKRSNQSISRKPLPNNTIIPSSQIGPVEVDSPDSPVNHESWEGSLIDADALERVLNQPAERTDTLTTAASSATPDYASTIESSHSPKKSVEKPRAGRLKTVGDPTYQPAESSGGMGRLDTWEREQTASAAGIPSVDFGPTFTYKPKSRPATSGTITPGGFEERRRSRSGDRLRESSSDRLGGSKSPLPRISPGSESNRQSYFGGRMTSSPGGMTPIEQGLNTPGDRNSIAWMPTSTPGGPAPGARRSMTPEQWVHHRAAIAAQPQQAPARRPVPAFAHQRQSSSSSMHQLWKSVSKTPPPLARTGSGDWTQYGQRATPPSRPQSRGAGSYLNQPSPSSGLSTAQPAKLTAKEQMQVARATGTPLVNYTSSAEKKQQEHLQPGLFGALAAREREKEELKRSRTSNGMSTSAVQQAIAARQQQVEADAHAQAQAYYQMQMQQAAQQAQQTQAAHLQQMQQMQYQQMMMSQQGYQPPSSTQGYRGANEQPFNTATAQRLYQGQQQDLQRPGQGPPSSYGGYQGAPSNYGGYQGGQQRRQ